MSRLIHAVCTFTLLSAIAVAPAQAESTRTYVATTGNDANTALSCAAATPCRTLGAALGQTSPGGEILVVNGSGYGPLTIDRSVSITTNPGVVAGIDVGAGGTGITIATAGVSVVLRGLTINGVGGTNGVAMINGAKLSIENCVIANFTAGNGVAIMTPAKVRIINSVVRDNTNGVLISSGASASIVRSAILGNTGIGIHVGSESAVTSTAAVSDSLIVGGTFGVAAYSATSAAANARVSVIRSTVSDTSIGGIAAVSGAGTALASVSYSMVTGNVTGLVQSGAGATLKSLGNNTVLDNASAVSGTLTAVSPL